MQETEAALAIPSVVQENLKRKHFMPDSESSLMKVTARSIDLELVSQHARLRDNSLVITQAKTRELGMGDMKSVIIEMRELLGGKNVCALCWLCKNDPDGNGWDHSFVNCTAILWHVSVTKGSHFSSLKSAMQLPTGHCFKYTLLQVSHSYFILFMTQWLTAFSQVWDIHENLGLNKTCKHSDFLWVLAYALWVLGKPLKKICAEKEVQFSSLKQFSQWLVKKEDGWLNLIHIAVWAW